MGRMVVQSPELLWVLVLAVRLSPKDPVRERAFYVALERRYRDDEKQVRSPEG